VYKRLVRSSEQDPEDTKQAALFDEGREGKAAEPEAPEEKETITDTRKKKAGRKVIPHDIPREEHKAKKKKM
jgi:hypothetical protein